MSIKTLIAAVGAVAVLGAGVPAHAAPPPAPAAAPVPDPRAEALVRRYLAAIHFERTMDAMQASILPMLSEQSARSYPTLTAEDRQLIVEIVRKVMREKMTPQMIDRMVPIYASTFTTEELEAMVAFYESPVGRSITDKTPSLAPKSAGVMRELMPGVTREVMTEIITKLCQGGKCDAAKPPKAAAS
jgi:uncharacterized protein